MRPSPDCLSDPALRAFVDGRLDAAERSAADEHLAGCATCRERLATALRDTSQETFEPVPAELLDRARDLVPEPSATRSPATSTLRVWLPLAAALLLAVGLATVWRAPTVDPDGEVLRDQPASLNLELEDPADLTGPRPLLRWQAVPGARRYDLQVVDTVGEVVFDVGTAETSVELPRAALDLQPGATYYWSVRAVMRDGTVLESELRRVIF